ncbi:MAG: hypothetical protein CMP33_05795 [Rickettsiales bacterium]|nr:hypothetical protein [Rickettsiales bacterium]
MINSNISKIIITFAFFYSALMCNFKAIELYDNGHFTLSYFIWFCSFLALMGALRFQIAKIIYFIIKKKKQYYGKK